MNENECDKCIIDKNFSQQRELCYNGKTNEIIISIIKFDCIESLKNIESLLDINHIENLFKNNKITMGLISNMFNIDVRKFYNFKENNLYLRDIAIRTCNFEVIMFLISKGFIFTHRDLEILYLKNPTKTITIRKLLNPKFNRDLFDINLSNILDLAIYLGDIKLITYLKNTCGAKFKKRHSSLMKIYLNRKIISDEENDIILTPDEILSNGKGLIEILYIASSLCIPINFDCKTITDFKVLIEKISNKIEYDNNCHNSMTCLGNEIKFIPKDKFFLDKEMKYGFEMEEILQFKENPYNRLPLDLDKDQIQKKKEFYEAMGYPTKIVWNFQFTMNKINFEHRLGLNYLKSILYENYFLTKTEFQRIKTYDDLNSVYNVRKILEPNKMEEFYSCLDYI